ncbi:MAG TPA: hypothetical protein VGJ15_00765, partial [Pirellulales bacterium]
MKIHAAKFLTITTALAAMLSYGTLASAAPRNGGGEKSGGGVVGNVERAADNAAKQDNEVKSDSKVDSKAQVTVDANRAGVNVNVDGRRDGDVRRDAEVRRDANRDANLDKRDDRRDAHATARLGDHEFDRNGIGLINDRDFRNRTDNRWRYQRYGNEWWYWVPQGYWMFYRGDRWN